MGHFTSWTSLSLSPKFGLRPKISQNVKSFLSRVSILTPDIDIAVPSVRTASVRIQWRANRKSYMVHRTAPFSMTLKDPKPRFQGQVIL